MGVLEIFERTAALIIEQIKFIVQHRPISEPQRNINADIFTRRSELQSKINHINNLKDLYDHIRMLTPGYPKAYIDMSGFKFEFDSAELDTEVTTLKACVVIKAIN